MSLCSTSGVCSIFDTFLVEYLRNRYIETRYIPEGKEWPPNQPKYYVNLAVVHYDQGSRTQEEVIFSAQYHRHLDLITDREKEAPPLISSTTMHSKITKEIVSLFMDDPHMNNTEANAGNSISLPKSILIEGAPGIGKTILLKEIAYRLANGTILDNARIVFLIYLRNTTFQSVTTINEVIQYFDCLEEKEIPAVVKRLKQSNGEGVVFLIDGLDEYPGALQNTFLTCLIDRKTLPKSVLVITSRPYASASLHNRVERRIEILGFASDEREEYISRFLISPEKRKILEVYLNQHPMLNSLVYIPFHLTVLLFLFQQDNLPETLTEMNESFILHTVYRHMEKHDLPRSCVVKLDDFPKDVYHIVCKLCKLAFEGLQKNQLVFTFDEVKQICPEVGTTPGALNGFGLLQAVQHCPAKGAGTTVSFNFLHLTMQEFLAAWYISHCSVEQQVQLLKESFMKIRYWDELGNSIARMWQMYVGIVGVNCDAWVQFTTQCNICLDTFGDPLQYLYYFQCLLEGKSKDIQLSISTVFIHNTIRLPSRVLLPYHIALLCLFLTKSTKQWKNYDFCGNAMGDVGVKVLVNFLLSNEKSLICIEVFDLSSNFLTSQSASFISSIIQKGTLGILNLSCNDLGDSGIEKVSQALKVNVTIKSLFLAINNIGIDGAKSLAIALCHNHTLKRLVISYNKIMDDGVMAISECFKISGENNTKLTCVKILDLSTNCLTSHSKTAVSTIMQEGALVYLGLSYNKLADSGAYEISKALQRNLTIKQLFISNNAIGVRGALSICVALCHNHTLEELDVSFNEILDDGVIAIAECLKTNRTLQSLSITHNNITEIGAIEISEVLKFNPIIEELKIEEKYVELLKPSGEQLLYNETVDRCYHIEVKSIDPSYHFQEIALIRVWNNKFL